MNKRCTNSSCRKNFSILDFYGNCPYCGKKYPQLVPARKNYSSFLAVRIMDYNGCKVKAIKAVRDFFGPDLGLREAKTAVDHVPEAVFVLRPNKAKQFMKQLEAFGGTSRIEHSCKKTDYCVRKNCSKPDIK